MKTFCWAPVVWAVFEASAFIEIPLSMTGITKVLLTWRL
jgi:hypothetical protein